MLRDKISKRNNGITYVYIFKLKIWIKSNIFKIMINLEYNNRISQYNYIKCKKIKLRR